MKKIRNKYSGVKTLPILILLLTFIGFDKISLAESPSVKKNSPLPRFVSLKQEKTYLRTGPGVQYPIDWVYQIKKLPLEVILEFGTWRKVRDVRGGQGWIHQSMLSNVRTFIITGQIRTLRKSESSKSNPVAKLEVNVVGKISKCKHISSWCIVSADGYKGWLRRVDFWGVYPQEVIK